MENRNWFVHVEWVVVLITLLGGFYLIDGKIERQGERTDRICEMHTARSDRLYEMFIDLLKETKCSKDNSTKT